MVNFYSTLSYRVMAKKKLRLKALNKQNGNVDFVEKTVRYVETDGQWCQIADVSLFFYNSTVYGQTVHLLFFASMSTSMPSPFGRMRQCAILKIGIPYDSCWNPICSITNSVVECLCRSITYGVEKIFLKNKKKNALAKNNLEIHTIAQVRLR